MELISSTGKDNNADVVEVRYSSGKEVTRYPIFQFFMELVVDAVQKPHSDTLLIRFVDKMGEPDIFMDSLAHSMVWNNVLIKWVVHFVSFT